ncbi:MAG: hypothetical protein Q8L41_06655 [Anaerolineales bacterium]|nr:hypothetical protein [Anaerolineales bacterium]
MNRPINNKRLSFIKPWHALAALILFNLLIAALIGDNFGAAWDEPSYYIYGERSLDAYIRGLSGLDLIPKKHIYFIDLRYYGPFYAVVGKLTTDTLTFVFKSWSYADIWHFVNFSFFQAALISLYSVAKRFMNSWAAFGIVLLFSTQPLLFGHAFINPKDIPFMTFFLASIACGFIMVESFAGKNRTIDSAGTELQASNLAVRYNLVAAILFGLFVFSIVGKDVIAAPIGWAVSFVYNSPPDSTWSRLFSMLANRADQLPVESYIHKAVNSKIEQILIVAVFILITANKIISGYKQNNKDFFSKFFYQIDLQLIFKILMAGVVLGLATSIRLLAPFAGLLILGYSLLTSGRKSLPSLIYYFSIAALITYLTWPFLWDKPIYHLIESFQVMRSFPFNGAVRFMGDNFASSNLPWTYIPTLVSIQITAPVIILSLIGFIISLWKSIKTPGEGGKFLVIYSWLLVPVGLQIILHSSVYDNFRQFLFILPPIFILAGMALETILKRINHRLINIALSILFLAPGLIGIISLHPYQYIYYNRFIGGLRGAAGNFETDYWLTSYREAAVYLNENAPTSASILAWGASSNIADHAREDLLVHLIVWDFSSDDIPEVYDYAVITTRFDNHLFLFQNAETVFEVRKDGVLLSVVKKLK